MKLILIAFTLSLTISAHAGLLGNSFFIEPYLGYKIENSKMTDLSNEILEIKTSSPSLGIKIGFRSMAGVDLNIYGDINQGKAEISNLIEKNNFNKKSAGFQLGVNSIGFVKMYLGGSFLNDFTVEESSQTNAYTLSGPSFHAGLLFKTFSFLNLGIQYNLNQYNQIKGNSFSTGEKLDTYFSKIDTIDYSLYLSMIF